jgi:hypothetical protein
MAESGLVTSAALCGYGDVSVTTEGHHPAAGREKLTRFFKNNTKHTIAVKK